MKTREELELEIFGIHSEYDIKTLGDQKRFVREIVDWYYRNVAKLEAERDALSAALEKRGEEILGNWVVDDEFRNTLIHKIQDEPDGNWLTLLRFMPTT